MRKMKAYQPAQTLRFFDVELRVQRLEAKGNPLGRLGGVGRDQGRHGACRQTPSQCRAEQTELTENRIKE